MSVGKFGEALEETDMYSCLLMCRTGIVEGWHGCEAYVKNVRLWEKKVTLKIGSDYSCGCKILHESILGKSNPQNEAGK